MLELGHRRRPWALPQNGHSEERNDEAEERSDDPDSIGVVRGSSPEAWAHHPRPLASLGVTLCGSLLRQSRLAEG